MRTHFYDLLASSVVDPRAEALQLHYLLSEEKIYWAGHGRLRTLETHIDETFFRALSFRGTHLCIADMRKALNVRKGSFEGAGPRTPSTFNMLLLFSEFLLAVASEGESRLMQAPPFHQQMNTIVNNILHFVDKTNHRLENIGDTGTPRYIIVEKNKLTAQAVGMIEERPVALAAIEYNHFTLHGDLSGKQTILLQLANYVEPILHSNILKDNGYAQLQSDTGFVLNNLHIRHNNKTGTKRKDYTATVSDEDLETWYDRAYSLMLSVIVAKENVVAHTDIEQLKSQYKW